jgi:hypothetical protein
MWAITRRWRSVRTRGIGTTTDEDAAAAFLAGDGIAIGSGSAVALRSSNCCKPAARTIRLPSLLRASGGGWQESAADASENQERLAPRAFLVGPLPLAPSAGFRFSPIDRSGPRRGLPELPMKPFFILVKCQLGKAYDVANRIADAEIASEVYSTAGDYDLLVKIYVEENADIGHFIAEKVHTIDGIQDTKTIVTFKAF